MADERKGLLDNFLAPLGQSIVDPNGAVTGALGQESLEEQRRREMERARLAAEQSSIMEAAPMVAEPRKLSAWNPFVLLFGQPGDPNDKGLMGK